MPVYAFQHISHLSNPIYLKISLQTYEIVGITKQEDFLYLLFYLSMILDQKYLNKYLYSIFIKLVLMILHRLYLKHVHD